MKRIMFILAVLLLSVSFSFADVISGKVRQDEKLYAQNQVVDAQSGEPVDRARVSIPKQRYETYSDGDGKFELNTKIDSTTVLSVEKEGFRPYSLTIDKNSLNQPLKLGIERSKPNDIQLEAHLFHLGDDVFADTSANSGDFRIKSAGTFFTKRFSMSPVSQKEEAVLVIGTVIGLDTRLAKEMGQNRIAHVYSSPAEVIFNGQKIGELSVNGDNQEIIIPRNLIRADNEVTVRTGRNLFQHAYVDYDDIELANLRVETRDRQMYANSGW